MSKNEISFPYLNESFSKNNFVKRIIFLHILPYMLKPKSIVEIQKFQLPVLFKTQLLFLDEQKTEHKKNRLKIKAIEGSKITDRASDYYAYKLEYDFYQGLGGDKALMDAYTLNDICEFIIQKSQYIMTIHSLVKTHLSLWDKYNNKMTSIKPSQNECYRQCMIEPDLENPSIENPYAEYQTLGRKAMEEGAWKEFKNSSHLIYGYVEALLNKGIIPNKPSENKQTFIKDNISKVLCDFDKNSILLNDILKNSLQAQNSLINNKHANSSKDLDLWLLPEDKLRSNYAITK